MKKKIVKSKAKKATPKKAKASKKKYIKRGGRLASPSPASDAVTEEYVDAVNADPQTNGSYALVGATGGNEVPQDQVEVWGEVPETPTRNVRHLQYALLAVLVAAIVTLAVVL